LWQRVQWFELDIVEQLPLGIVRDFACFSWAGGITGRVLARLEFVFLVLPMTAKWNLVLKRSPFTITE
jgi:hypothetical protein